MKSKRLIDNGLLDAGEELFKSIKKTTINDLESIIAEMKNIELKNILSFTFNTKDIQDFQIADALLNEIKKDIDHKRFQYIYIFSIKNTNFIDEIYRKYKNAKEIKKSDRAYARVNGKSNCLYVGSSGALISRIKQHMGFGPIGTYAMQLKYWCDLDIDICIVIYAFDKSLNKKTIQTFEDGAWNYLKPMLGRQGQR